MVKKCPYCGETEKNDQSQFCMHCGNEFLETDVRNQLLLKIHQELIESNKSTEKFNLMIFILTIGSLCFTFITVIIGDSRRIVEDFNIPNPSITTIQNDGIFLDIEIGFIVFLLILVVISGIVQRK